MICVFFYFYFYFNTGLGLLHRRPGCWSRDRCSASKILLKSIKIHYQVLKCDKNSTRLKEEDCAIPMIVSGGWRQGGHGAVVSCYQSFFSQILYDGVSEGICGDILDGFW